MNVLNNLRSLFVVYFTIKVALDIYLVSINAELFKEISAYSIPELYLPYKTLALIIFLFDALIFIVCIWLFNRLVDQKNWARVLLLIIAWIVIADFVVILILSPVEIDNLKSITTSFDWNFLIRVGTITDLLSVLFWGYLIIRMQFNLTIREKLFT